MNQSSNFFPFSSSAWVMYRRLFPLSQLSDGLGTQNLGFWVERASNCLIFPWNHFHEKFFRENWFHGKNLGTRTFHSLNLFKKFWKKVHTTTIDMTFYSIIHKEFWEEIENSYSTIKYTYGKTFCYYIVTLCCM